MLAESTLISTGIEAVGQLVVDVKSFEIKKARWEICRSPGGSLNGGKELPELNGVEAYFSAGAVLRRVVGEAAGGLPRELLAECVKGLIQAETFIYRDRGFPSATAYDEYWDKMYLNACRYYSNLERVTCTWMGYVVNHQREGNLFNRFLGCRVYRQDEGKITASGHFSDSFHELGVLADLDGKGEVARSTGSFQRAPDPVCFECSQHARNLIGKKIAQLTKKEIGTLVGGSQGCNHMVDVVFELSRAVKAATGE